MAKIEAINDPYVDALKYGDSEALRRLFALACKNHYTNLLRLDCPPCAEWDDEYQAAFSVLSDKLKGDPYLLLFLHQTVSGGGEKSVQDWANSGKIGAYAIVRPEPLGSVVEAAISVKRSSDEHYLTCEVSLPLPMLKSRQLIRGLPFMEQDGVVSCCAHASLWMASRLVAARFPALPNCGVITCGRVAAATVHEPAVLKRKLPTSGLSLQEILMALEADGYAPLSYEFESEEEKGRADQIIYRYIESGIPVILLLALEDTGHSVVVCGHTFDSDAWWPGARQDYFPSLAAEDQWLSSALWSPQYLILDDNYGPALAMSRGSLRTRSVGAVVPLPRAAGIFLTAEDAEKVGAGLLFADGVIEAMAHQEPHNAWSLWTLDAQERSSKFVLRTLLVDSDKLIAQLANCSGYRPSTIKALQQRAYPDRVWLIEVSLPTIFGNKLKVGELILDPQVPTQFIRGAEPLLILHLPGFVWIPGQDPLYPGSETPSPVIVQR